MVKIAKQFLPFFAFVELTLIQGEFDTAICTARSAAQMAENSKNRDPFLLFSAFVELTLIQRK